MFTPHQCNAQIVFQPADLIADGWLGQPQGRRRCRQAAATGDLGKNAHPSKIERPLCHRNSLYQSSKNTRFTGKNNVVFNKLD